MHWISSVRAVICVACLMLASSALAMRTGASGNAPVEDQGWPTGALESANLKTRVGWWEGPWGGQWQFLYRGNTTDFQVAVDAFAAIDAPKLVLVVYQGPGDDPVPGDNEKGSGADWDFVVHGSSNVRIEGELPAALRQQIAQPPTMHVYVAGPGAGGDGIDFSQIFVPEKIAVQDRRATSAGYKIEDTSILRGRVTEMGTGKALSGAEVVLGTPTQNGVTQVTSVRSNDDGRFELRKVTPGTYAVTASAKGYAPRRLGYAKVRPNSIEDLSGALAAAASVSGTVIDTAGRPVAGVTVRADEVIASDGQAYPAVESRKVTTDAQGRFAFTDVPRGELRFHAYGKMHLISETMKRYTIPAEGITIAVVQTGAISGKVANWQPQAEQRSVNVEPETGAKVGTWGGSKYISPDGTFSFDGVPPGRYVVYLSNATTQRQTVDVKPGEAAEVTLESLAK